MGKSNASLPPLPTMHYYEDTRFCIDDHRTVFDLVLHGNVSLEEGSCSAAGYRYCSVQVYKIGRVIRRQAFWNNGDVQSLAVAWHQLDGLNDGCGKEGAP